MMPTTSNEVLKQFADSVLTLLDDHKAKMHELKKLKERIPILNEWIRRGSNKGYRLDQ